MTRLSRRLLIAGAASALVLAVTPAPANAIPPAGPNQSVTFTYYSTAAKTTVVGGWSYGSCGEPFDWGTHTRYSTYRIITCTPGGGQ
ncbi:hypothetical protein Lfu02_04280 [Longispora fulva]|uniref:Uncharacterized protein n=1 Tax=Longispora fulva TaxID=619741 RepID=A0A8J7KF41_9ACTN|nr:hypothetical protein [Longispora fulva]MBG6135705.1 hypothetical protein [Longispora fulva]GIG56056.1 hypothetical protein Lfu02_04280 [Longispora fulva]